MARKVWIQVIQTSGAKIYVIIAGLVNIFITARYLGPEGRGISAAALSWVGLFSSFGHFSFPQVVFYLAAGKKRDEWLPATLGTLLVLVAMITVIGWSVAIIGYIGTNGRMFNNLHPAVLLAVFAALPFMLWIEDGNAILTALGSLKVLNAAQVIGASLSLVLVFIFVVYFGWGVIGALVAASMNPVLAVGIGLLYIFRETSEIRIDLSVARKLLLGGVKLHLNAIGTVFMAQANILIINHFRPPEETGYYQLAMQLISAIQVIPVAISMVVYTMIANKGPDGVWPEQRKLLGQSLLLVAGLSVVAYLVAPFGIDVVAGRQFMPAVPLFRILLLTMIGMTFSTVMASQWIARGLFVPAATISFVLGVLNVIGNYLFVPQYGMFGAAWVTIVTYGIGTIVNGAMALWVDNKPKEGIASAA